MSHIWRNDVGQVAPTPGWVMSHIRMSHIWMSHICVNPVPPSSEWDMSNGRENDVSQVTHTTECVMSHIRMSHTCMNMSHMWVSRAPPYKWKGLVTRIRKWRESSNVTHTTEWVISHIWMSNICVWHSYERVFLHTNERNMSHVWGNNASHVTQTTEWVMSRIQMSRISTWHSHKWVSLQMNEICHMYAVTMQVMSHTRPNESCHTHGCHTYTHVTHMNESSYIQTNKTFHTYETWFESCHTHDWMRHVTHMDVTHMYM